LPPPSSQDFWDGDDPSLAALIFHPFAGKEYVRRQVRPIQERVNDRDVDARAQQGI
jgi:hypothetical protein